MRGSRPPAVARGPAELDRGGPRLDVAYIIGTYPELTTTFIDREIDVLQRAGVTVQIVSIRRPDQHLSRAPEGVEGRVHYLLPVRPGDLLRSHLGFLFRRPFTYLGTLLFLLRRPHPSARARLWTLFHFAEGVPVASLLRDRYPCRRIHAHFVDRAAVVALIAARFLDRPYSATAHANDIYVDPVLLAEKVAAAEFIVTCTEYNRAHLLRHAANGDEPDVVCIYHGLDLAEYRPPARLERRSQRPLLLAVAQLQEKKGLADLVEACRLLRVRGYDFACEIVGDGPLRPVLEAAIAEKSLSSVVWLRGALPHHEVIERYRAATIFALPCVTAPNGGRDGIPNVILEAMAMELPVVSTRHSGVPEAVDDGRGGLLVPPGNPPALADALARLLDDEDLRHRLGRHGRRVVEQRFDAEANGTRLRDRLAA